MNLCGLFQQGFSKVGKSGYLVKNVLKIWQNKRSPSNFIRALMCKLTKVFINLKVIVILYQQNVWNPTSRVKVLWKCCQVDCPDLLCAELICLGKKLCWTKNKMGLFWNLVIEFVKGWVAKSLKKLWNLQISPIDLDDIL